MKYLFFLLFTAQLWSAERFMQVRFKNPLGGYRWAVIESNGVLADSANGAWAALSADNPAYLKIHMNANFIPESLKMSISGHLRPKNIGEDSSSVVAKIWSKDFLDRVNYPFLRRGGSVDTTFSTPADSGTFSQQIVFGVGDIYLGIEIEPGDSASMMNSGDTIFIDTLGINVQN